MTHSDLVERLARAFWARVWRDDSDHTWSRASDDIRQHYRDLAGLAIREINAARAS